MQPGGTLCCTAWLKKLNSCAWSVQCVHRLSTCLSKFSNLADSSRCCQFQIRCRGVCPAYCLEGLLHYGRHGKVLKKPRWQQPSSKRCHPRRVHVERLKKPCALQLEVKVPTVVHGDIEFLTPLL